MSWEHSPLIQGWDKLGKARTVLGYIWWIHLSMAFYRVCIVWWSAKDQGVYNILASGTTVQGPKYNVDQSIIRLVGYGEKSGIRELVGKTFENHCWSGLYTVTFHTSRQVVEEAEIFGRPEMLYGWLLDTISAHIIGAYKFTLHDGGPVNKQTVVIMIRRTKPYNKSLEKSDKAMTP